MPSAPRVLLVAPTTGYQVARFQAAAASAGVELILATDCCHQLEATRAQEAVPIRFDNAKAALGALKPLGPFQGITAVGDRAAVLAAQVAPGLGVRFHSAGAAAVCHDKFEFKQVVAAADLPTPWFERYKADASPAPIAAASKYPCVLKPLILSGSRGVIRCNDAAEFVAAFQRIRTLLATPAIQQWQDPGAKWIQAEGYIEGREFALEGWMAAGIVQRFALFDKPEPLEGPYFEESLYVTPSRLDTEKRALIWDMVEAAARAAGLGPGPIHAEIRLGPGGRVYVLEVAARPIGGQCARALRFRRAGAAGTGARPAADGATPLISLEELLLRAALGQPPGGWERETAASGVMMIPIPGGGVLDQVEGVEEARQVGGIEAVEITAKAGEPLLPLPAGATYLGFIFARAGTPDTVEAALRTAHGKLKITMREALPVL